MNAIDHMVLALSNQQIVFNQPEDREKITKEEWDKVEKEFLFEKLKGKSLAKVFVDKFKITDYIFELNISDNAIAAYIKTHYLK